MLIKATVHISNGFFIFEVIHIPDASENKIRFYTLAAFNGKPFINHNVHFRVVFVDFPDPGLPLFFTEHRRFVSVPAYPYDQLVEQVQRPVYNVEVTNCYRIKSSRKKANPLHNVYLVKEIRWLNLTEITALLA